MSILKFNVGATSGNVTGVGAGSAASGSVVFMGKTRLKVTDLAALVAVTANASGLTFTPRWQVSNDQTTWYTLKDSANAAVVALATGASGAGNDAKSAVVTAPSGVKGWQYARAQVVVGGATGTTNDLYSLAYSYRQHASSARK